MQEYPWYASIEKTSGLEQGDIILSCQIVKPLVQATDINQQLEANVAEYDVVVMSQSCDLAAEKIDLVLVCPFYSLKNIGEMYGEYKADAMKEKLRKGSVIGFHLLNKCKIKTEEDYLVVDFKNVYSVPLPFLKKIATAGKERIRLLPPYREHLSQAFARFFMRVGLPVDIPAFEAKKQQPS